MTIAACYLSPEGVVLGADSTSTYFFEAGDRHYFNHGQKLYELGQDSPLGVVTWGLGGIGLASHRLLLARLADDVRANPLGSVNEAAVRLAEQFWDPYSTDLAAEIQECRDLDARPA